MRIKLRSAGLGVGIGLLVWGGAASADIQTFWKTNICPNFGGLKPPIAAEPGFMEAPIDVTVGGGVGAAYCNLFATPEIALPGNTKTRLAGNARMFVEPGDFTDIGVPGDTWACVVCQYEDKVAAHPALSVVGTALLLGGLVTAMLYELRRRQSGGSA
jgi:hypothetical protein